jgi:hypothetical protein
MNAQADLLLTVIGADDHLTSGARALWMLALPLAGMKVAEHQSTTKKL